MGFFNLDWAPCTDVDSNPDNPVIGDRLFSQIRTRSRDMPSHFLEGLHEVGVMGSLKHFPGHGDTNLTHVDLPVVDKDVGDLQHLELLALPGGH